MLSTIHQRYTYYVLTLAVFWLFPFWVSAATATSTFQDGIDGYAGTEDTWIASATADTDRSTDTSLNMDGDPEEAALLRWDLSGIPRGATIESVTLELDVHNTGDSYEIYEVLQPWIDSATWNTYDGSTSWGTAGMQSTGVDRGSTSLGTLGGATSGVEAVSLNASGVAVVQEWVDGTKVNNGFTIQDYAQADGVQISSSEDGVVADRPKLIVVYTPTEVLQEGVDGYSGNEDTWIDDSNTTTSYGSATKVEIDGDTPQSSGLIKWDLSNVPSNATLQGAVIDVDVSNGGDAYALYQALRPWTESATWNTYDGSTSWGTAGAQLTDTDRGDTVLGHMEGITGRETVTLNSDGLAVMQDWIDGTQTNHGFVIQDYSLTDGIEFLSSDAYVTADRPKLALTYATSSFSTISGTAYSDQGDTTVGAGELVKVAVTSPDSLTDTDTVAADGDAYSVAWNGNYVAVGSQWAEIKLYELSGDSLTLLDTASGSGGGEIQDLDWSGDYLAAVHSGGNNLSLFKLNRGTDELDSLTDPNALPDKGWSVEWNGNYLAAGHGDWAGGDGQNLSLYKLSTSTDTLTELTDPTPPDGGVLSVDWSGDYLAVGLDGSITQKLQWYELDTGTDTLSQLTDPTNVAGKVDSVAWNGDHLAVKSDSGNRLFFFKRSGSTLTKLTDPTALPSGSPTWRGDYLSWYGDTLAVAHYGGDNLFLYERDDDSLNKLPDPTTQPPGNGIAAGWNDSGYLLVAHANSSGDHGLLYQLSSGSVVTAHALTDGSGNWSTEVPAAGGVAQTGVAWIERGTASSTTLWTDTFSTSTRTDIPLYADTVLVHGATTSLATAGALYDADDNSNILFTATSTGTTAFTAEDTLLVPSGVAAQLPDILTLKGSFTKRGTVLGADTAVTLAGSEQILNANSTTTFSSLTKTVSDPDTLWFSSGAAWDVTDSLDLTGAAENLLSLRSTTTASAGTWYIDAPTDTTASYLDVEYSHNVASTAVSCGSCTDSGNNTNWSFDTLDTVTLEHATTSFYVGQMDATLPTVTIDQGSEASVTTATDIRIKLPTDTMPDLQFDDAVTSVTLGGTASGKVSASVSYEATSTVAVLTVSSDFVADDVVTVDGLEVTGLTTVGHSGNLSLYLDSDTTGEAVATANSDIGVTGSITQSAHANGQADNQFSFQNTDDAPVFAFELIVSNEDMSITNAEFLLDGYAAALSNLRLYQDNDSDGVMDGSDTLVASGGTLSGSMLTFGDTFTATTSRDYILVADVSNVSLGTTLEISLSDMVVTGVTSERAVTLLGAVDPVEHERAGGGSGGSGGIRVSTQGQLGDDVATSTETVTGGDGDGGDSLDPNSGDSLVLRTGYYAPSSTDGAPLNQWTNGANAYSSNGSYATADSDGLQQSYGDFGISIPGGNEITGVTVKFEANSTAATGTISVALSWDGGSTFTTARTSATLADKDAVYSVGGESDEWGRSWSDTEFSNENFVLRVTSDQPGATTHQLDTVHVRPHHQTTGGSGGGGGALGFWFSEWLSQLQTAWQGVSPAQYMANLILSLQ